MIKNTFYLAKKEYDSATIFAGYSWASGSWQQISDNTICSSTEISVKDVDRIKTDTKYTYSVSAIYYWLDKDKNVIRSISGQAQKFDLVVPDDAVYFAIEIQFSKEMSSWDDFYIYKYVEVTPHYKTLSKKYKRESNQMFFRETLDGKVKLFGIDYEYIKNSTVEHTLVFDVYRNDIAFATTEFNKTDCTFDHAARSVELKLTSHDKYTKILNKYKNTYDLIKCAPATTWLTLTKRNIVQIYIQGEKVISNYSGGTYWETDVDSACDSADDLRNKYYFYPGPQFREISLSGFNYSINSAYTCLADSDCWNGTSYEEVYGKKYEMPCSIKFTKVLSRGDNCSGYDVRKLSDGTSSDSWQDDYGEYCNHDSYRIEIYTGQNGTGTKIYQSDKLYGKDGDFTVAQGASLYPMTRISQSVPMKDPTPNTFNLGNYVIEYNLWVRELCSADSIDGTATYDLPYDDFATERHNYKKCIGLSGVNGENSVIRVKQKLASSDEPTSYGQNDFGKYFSAPYILGAPHGWIPLARSTWGNTSLWVYLDNLNGLEGSFETWCQKTYKEYTTKDNYHIAAVIKALLNKIDPNIKHEATEEYSQFLYGTGINCASQYYLAGCQLYITQKTNLLKGEYDQAAQKAEVTLEKVMSMLRDCFRCYWYIDSENRFRIEHVYYFMHGFSYSTSGTVGLDLTKKTDKFNKRPVLYSQQELKYEKSDLKSRYEFGWMDDVTDAMGNIAINFENAYIPQDNSEDVTIDQFCPDVDYMLFLPDDFSEDGFALLAAKDGKVPIVNRHIYDAKQYGSSSEINLYTQNGYLSWRQLIQHYCYDAPGNSLTLDDKEGPNIYYASYITRSMEHEVEVQSEDEIDITKMIKTTVGNACIEDMSVDVDTNMTKLTLTYEPT